MIGEWIRFGLCAFCVLGGLFAVFTAILGLFRFDFALNRLHASAVADTLGLLLMALGAAIAVGNEGRGLTDALLEKCDTKIILPMTPGSESLNAAVAASILMWEMWTQRG